MVKYKCFWIEVVDNIEEDPVYSWKFNVYYNGICCTTDTRITEGHALAAAKYWVDNYGFDWLGDN